MSIAHKPFGYVSKLLALSLVFICSFLLFASSAHAGTSELKGWAWSSNIGWISFNSKDAGAGGGPYAVTVATTTGSTIGNMEGYAWSSNVGWIKFGGLTGMPSSGANATIDFSDGEVNGWARACLGTIKSNDPYLQYNDYPVHTPLLNGNCSTMTSRPDGWDGWISLSGTNYTSPDTSGEGGISAKGITLGIDNTKPAAFGKLTGYAWGGDVVGWVGFSPVAEIPGTGVVVCNPPCGGGGGSTDATFNVNGEKGVVVPRSIGTVDGGVVVSGGTTGAQTIEITLGSFTPDPGTTVSLRDENGNAATGGKVTCALTTSLPTCRARVRVSVSDLTQIENLNSITVPVVGTRISPSLPNNNVLQDTVTFTIPNDSSSVRNLWLVESLVGGGYNTTKQLEKITIKENSTANLAWSTSGMDEGTCRGINVGPNDSAVLTAWKGSQTESRGSNSPFVITGLLKGQYNLQLRCEVDGTDTDTLPVLIKVIKSDETEF